MPFVKVTLIDNEPAAFWTSFVKKIFQNTTNKCIVILFNDDTYWEVKGTLDEIIELINSKNIHDFVHNN
jgi:hypothetical protein